MRQDLWARWPEHNVLVPIEQTEGAANAFGDEFQIIEVTHYDLNQKPRIWVVLYPELEE